VGSGHEIEYAGLQSQAAAIRGKTSVLGEYCPRVCLFAFRIFASRAEVGCAFFQYSTLSALNSATGLQLRKKASLISISALPSRAIARLRVRPCIPRQLR
jgi:hypothetical protein